MLIENAGVSLQGNNTLVSVLGVHMCVNPVAVRGGQHSGMFLCPSGAHRPTGRAQIDLN